MSSNDRRTLERPAKKEAPRQSFLTGAFGGFSLVAVSHPFDLIKVRMQAASSTASPLATLRQAIGGPAGLLGLYRGVSPVLMGTPPILGLNLQCYLSSKELVSRFSSSKVAVSDLSLLQIGYAGALGAIPMTLIVAPAEQVKIQLQTSNASLWEAFKSLFSGRESMRTLRNGILLTGLRDVPAGFLYFSTYEGLKKVWGPDTYGPLVVPMAGGTAGTLTWLATIPMDTIKTKIQASSGTASILSVISLTITQEGWRGLYQGLTPTLLRAFPASASFFAGMELSAMLLSKYS